MSHNIKTQHKVYKRKDRENEETAEETDELNIAGILKKMQQQITFLERKIDNLTHMLENKSGRESQHSKFQRDDRDSSRGSSDRKFSRNYSRDDDSRPAGHHKDRGERSYGKPFAGASDDKKKDYSAKKSPSKFAGKKPRWSR